jgi:hypothetical protein
MHGDAPLTPGKPLRPSATTPPEQQPRRPTRERTIQPGPRCTLLVWWVMIDAAIATAAALWGTVQLDRGRPAFAWTLFGAATALVLLDAWRLTFLNRVRHLVSHGRIEQADVVETERTRLSLAPRADAPSPTGGWPIVPACRVTYVFDKKDGRKPVRGAFLVSTKEAGMFGPGEDVEVFVDRKDPSNIIPSLVARWYFRVSSRMIGPASDDIEWDFTNPPPAVKDASRTR